MHIGSKIKALVVENSKIPLVDFAVKIGYTEPGMYNIFKSEDVNTKIIKLICKTLNINFSEFFEDKKEVRSYKSVSALGILHEEGEAYGIVNYKEKYYEVLEENRQLNNQLRSLTDIKKGSIRSRK